MAQKKPRTRFTYGAFIEMPDNDLLSHGETPHYHRRRDVSLLSSEWVQVVPSRYDRQAKKHVQSQGLNFNWESSIHALNVCVIGKQPSRTIVRPVIWSSLTGN